MSQSNSGRSADTLQSSEPISDAAIGRSNLRFATYPRCSRLRAALLTQRRYYGPNFRECASEVRRNRDRRSSQNFPSRHFVNKRTPLCCLFVGDRGGGREVDVLLPL